MCQPYVQNGTNNEIKCTIYISIRKHMKTFYLCKFFKIQQKNSQMKSVDAR